MRTQLAPCRTHGMRMAGQAAMRCLWGCMHPAPTAAAPAAVHWIVMGTALAALAPALMLLKPQNIKMMGWGWGQMIQMIQRH